MGAPLGELIEFIDGLLEPERFRDYCHNGVQFAGAERIDLIVSGVSAQLELFERAAELQASAVLVHHGLIWGSGARVIDRALKRRLAPLFAADMSLIAYHLPLDAHPEIGNNALLAKRLGAADDGPFGAHHETPIGRLGDLGSDGIPMRELLERVEGVAGRAPLAFATGPERVRRIAIVSGSGSDYVEEAIAAGCDAFLTGEPTERVMAQASEGSINFIAAGHYATETFGVNELGERLAERFGLRHIFLDIPNPI